MRLLMTRPEPDGSLSAERLRALGHEVIISPVLETYFDDRPLQWHSGIDIVVTSKNGARALSKLASDDMRLHARLFSVGDATAQLALSQGFQNVLSASGDVEALIRLISKEEPAHLIYVCGRDRKGNLEERLATLGFQVDVAARYRAECVSRFTPHARACLEEGSVDGILFYSRRTAEAFNTLINRYLLSYSTKQMTYFCLAKAVSSVFDRENTNRIIVANLPNEQSLLDAIEAYVEKQ